MKINFAKYFVKIISRKILAHVWRRKGGDASVKVVVVEPLRILSIWEQIDSRPPPNIVISPPWPIWQFKLHFRTFACCCSIANRGEKNWLNLAPFFKHAVVWALPLQAMPKKLYHISCADSRILHLPKRYTVLSRKIIFNGKLIKAFPHFFYQIFSIV